MNLHSISPFLFEPGYSKYEEQNNDVLLPAGEVAEDEEEFSYAFTDNEDLYVNKNPLSATKIEMENESGEYDLTDRFNIHEITDVESHEETKAQHYSVNEDDYFHEEVIDLEFPLKQPVLNPGKNTKASIINSTNEQKSGLAVQDIIATLRKTVNLNEIRQNLITHNQNNPGDQYQISGSNTVDALFTEAIHQFQIIHYLDPKEHDGILGPSTLDTLGLFNHKLRPSLNSAGFYGQQQLNLLKSKISSVTNGEFTASGWFDFIVKPAWLGVKISDGIHILLLRKLREAEAWLLSQPQYKDMTPASLGKALGFTADTRYSGARLSANKQAMHGFGLAIDINVSGNPWIGAGWVQNDKILLQERFRMIKSLRNASGDQTLPGNTVFEYLHHIAQASGNDTAAAYNTLKQRNDEFIAYLKSNSSELSYWKNSQTFAKRNPLNGFLNLHSDLVYALRQIAGLAWGAIDFGPRASGDIMHFDMRTIDVGKLLCEKINGYVPNSGHPVIVKEIFSDEIMFEQKNNYEFKDESDFHEAIEEADWRDSENESNHDDAG